MLWNWAYNASIFLKSNIPIMLKIYASIIYKSLTIYLGTTLSQVI